MMTDSAAKEKMKITLLLRLNYAVFRCVDSVLRDEDHQKLLNELFYRLLGDLRVFFGEACSSCQGVGFSSGDFAPGVNSAICGISPEEIRCETCGGSGRKSKMWEPRK